DACRRGRRVRRRGPVWRDHRRPAPRPRVRGSACARGAGRHRPRNRTCRPGELSLSLLVAIGDFLTVASGAASGARAATPRFNFDPSTTLAWAVPVMVMVPLVAFVLAATSVRTRRSAANMAMLGAVVTFALSLLVAWGLTRRSTPFETTYPYLNVPVAFTGPVNFQGFGIDIILRVDRLTSVALLVVEICVIGGIAWHRVMGRSEPGSARFYALVSVLLFAA